MHKLYILILAAFFVNQSSVLAGTPVDSIGTDIVNGKKVIIYKIEPKETYYSIAKKYNLSYKDLIEFNDSQLLQSGGTIKIPTGITASGKNAVVKPPAATPSTINSSTATQTPAITTPTVTSYTVKPKDNLNLIARNFNTTADVIKELNGLSSNNLQIGQVLKIPSGKTQTAVQENSTIRNMVPETSMAVNNNPAPAVKEKVKEVQKPVTRHYTTKITHKVKSGETLSGIAQKYDTTVEALKKLNKLKGSNLQIGQALKVEVQRTETVYVKTTVPAEKQQDEKPEPKITTDIQNSRPAGTSEMEHTVAAGETIYSIAKKYNLTTYQLKTANNLSSNDLSVGQKLIIKGATLPVTASAQADDEVSPSTNENTLTDPKLRQPASKFGLTRYDEKGTAVWITDPDLDPSKMLVLHRTAPVGTIIRITNPMTNRSAFAKVVGKFTENETTKDVIIVMTKAVADAVGALDKRFFCNINYGAVDNEQP